MTFIQRRIGYSLFVLAAVSIGSFALVEAAPGEFFDDLRQDPRVSPETVETLRRQYGFTDPPLARYRQWIVSVARGDAGYSLAYQTSVTSLLRARTRNTLMIAIPALVLAWCFAIAAGVWCAVHRNGAIDRVFAVLTSAALTLPDPVIALLFLVVALRTGWFTVGGHAALPICVLTVTLLPLLFRHVRAALVDVLDAGTLRATRGHGIAPARVLWRYAVPLAANPLVSLAGLSIGLLVSGSLLVEVVMGWPGLGPLLLDAILARDRYVVVGAAMLSAVFLVAGNLLADVALFAIDPRIRTR